MAISQGDLQAAFQRTLGRQPRPDELEFFIKNAQENELSAFEVGEILQGAPEAQRSLARTDTADYGRFLAASDQDLFGRAQSSLEARFRGMGRSASGSAYVAAYVDAAQKLAAQRSGQLADFYGQRVNAAAGAEATRGAGLRQRGYDLADRRRERDYELQDFYMSRDAYNDQLNAANRQRRRQAFGSLAGAGLGAALGSFAGPYGAIGGARVGSGLGGLFG